MVSSDDTEGDDGRPSAIAVAGVADTDGKIAVTMVVHAAAPTLKNILARRRPGYTSLA
jgi:hypothetical protein